MSSFSDNDDNRRSIVRKFLHRLILKYDAELWRGIIDSRDYRKLESLNNIINDDRTPSPEVPQLKNKPFAFLYYAIYRDFPARDMDNNFEFCKLICNMHLFVYKTFNNVFFIGGNMESPLTFSIKNESPSFVKMLLMLGADANFVPMESIPIHLACQKSNVIYAKLLLEHCAVIDNYNLEGNTILHTVTLNNSFEDILRITLPHIYVDKKVDTEHLMQLLRNYGVDSSLSLQMAVIHGNIQIEDLPLTFPNEFHHRRCLMDGKCRRIARMYRGLRAINYRNYHLFDPSMGQLRAYCEKMDNKFINELEHLKMAWFNRKVGVSL